MRLSVKTTAACIAAIVTLAGGAALAGKPKPDKPLSGVMSCLRGSNAMLVTARLGGGGTQAPENSIAALDEALPYAAAMQIDVSGSADGALFLMHDGTLDRTTTGTGPTADSYWQDVQLLHLKDEHGADTGLSIPTLDETLAWSQGKAILLIDKRLGATWAEIIQAVRLKGAEDRVIAIVRSPVEVAEIRRLSQKVGVQFDLSTADDWKRLRDLDVKSNTLIGWTGAGIAKPDLWKAAKKKVAIGFSTAGAPGKSYDETIAADGKFDEYDWFAQQGVDFLLTDAPHAASASKNAAKARKSCLNR